jgi:hypothetical protein
MKALLLLLLCILPLAGIGAELSIAYDQGNPSEHLFSTKSVVEVLGKLRGSGVLVLLDERPVIITNSHNLKGLRSAKVTLRSQTVRVLEKKPRAEHNVEVGLSVDAFVLHDYPLTDFAILGFPLATDPHLTFAIRELAGRNGKFCIKDPLCTPGWKANTQRPVLDVDNESYITAVIDAAPSRLNLIYPFNPKYTEAGIFVPVYGRPGVSGGGFYHNEVLQGLVTKVSLSGEPIVIATELKKIGEVLKADDEGVDSAVWQGTSLLIHHRSDEIILRSSNLGGGETGHGGGETGHGGGETGHGGGETGHGGEGPNGDFWQFQFSDFLGERILKTWNPFKSRSGSFSLNGELVSFIETQGRHQLPQIDQYLKNVRQNIPQKIHEAGKKSSQLLHRLRIQKDESIVFGRVYQYDKLSDRYVLLKTTQPTPLFEGAQLLKGEGGHPLTTRSRQGHLVDVCFRDDVKGEPLCLSIPLDRKTSAVVRAGKTTRLKSLASYGATVSYANRAKTIKLALIYDADDLTRLEKIYLQTENYLVELWGVPR